MLERLPERGAAGEKLPVLCLPDGTTIAGSANIIAWARSPQLA